MNRSTFLTIALIVSVVAAAGIYTYVTVSNDPARQSAGDKIFSGKENPIEYTDLEGNPISLSAYSGKVRVVNSWATWCPFCVTELPDFATLAAEYDEEIVVLAINRKESDTLVRSYLSQNDLRGDIVYVQNPDDRFYQSIGGFSMPETVFYDADGNVVFHKRGVMSLEEMRQWTEAALNPEEK